MTASMHTGHGPATWFAPSPLARQRTVERAGTFGRATWFSGALVAVVLLLTAIFRDPWALLPLAALAAGMAGGPALVRRGTRPEYGELAVGTAVTVAMAAGAGITGGAESPLVFLLPIGVVMNALRAAPSAVVFESLVTASVFVLASLLADGAAVLAEPLPMLAVLVGLTAVTAGCIAMAQSEIGYRKASVVDSLTGLLNRQGLEQRFEELRQQALLSAAPIAIVLFDLDHFKQVNDSYGHAAGDRLLREIAYEARKSLRKFELVYRVGGEEFLVLLPGLTEREAEQAAEQLRGVIDGVRLPSGAGATASFGVSGGDGPELEFEELYGRADRALYEAKRNGRDRVSVATS